MPDRSPLRVPFSSLSESQGIAWSPSSLLGSSGYALYFSGHLGGAGDKMAKPTNWESACIFFSCHTFAWSWITAIHQPVAPIDPLAGPPLWLFILFHGLISPESLLFNIFKNKKGKLFSNIQSPTCVSHKSYKMQIIKKWIKCTPESHHPEIITSVFYHICNYRHTHKDA